MTHSTDRDLLLRSLARMMQDNPEAQQFIFSLLVWMDGMSGYLETPPKAFTDISASKDEMLHDEWVRKYIK